MTSYRIPQRLCVNLFLMTTPTRNNFWIFLVGGFLELTVGLGVSLFIGLTQSKMLGLVLATGFFLTANFMFYMAYQRR